MNRPIVLVRVEPGEDGTLRVLSPGVGLWREPPEEGTVLGPGSGLGLLERLNRSTRLILPEHAAGRVAGPAPANRAVPVEYGQLLFMLRPFAGEADLPAAARAVFGQPAGTDLPPGARAILAPTDGVFYRGPAPGAPPFVAPGDRVTSGRLLGLVEVMKTFNQIVYGGPGFPDQAEVIDIPCGDAQEVRAGQVLVVLR
jgi:acetyl-CoA carboxylase biotin carboxyl carrier protein